MDGVVERLVVALEGLADGGDPHVIRREIQADRVHLRTAAGADFVIWREPSLNAAAIEVVDAAAAQGKPRWEHEPFDVYWVSGPGHAAVEVRSLAGESVLEAVVRLHGETLRGRVHQVDAARWEAEEEGVIGDEFQDFAERNALWAGLGGPRPSGWTLQVVEPGENWPR